MRAYNQAEEELLREIRLLAGEMIRYDVWIRHAQEFQPNEVEGLIVQRMLTRDRRSDLMRELWAGRVVVLA